jgi:hypothetical protein
MPEGTDNSDHGDKVEILGGVEVMSIDDIWY